MRAAKWQSVVSICCSTGKCPMVVYLGVRLQLSFVAAQLIIIVAKELSTNVILLYTKANLCVQDSLTEKGIEYLFIKMLY